MSNLYSKGLKVFCVTSFLVLAGCGGQAIKPEDSESVTTKDIKADEVEASGSQAAAATDAGAQDKSAAQSQMVEEEPVVEVMPREDATAAPIAVEPMPAKVEVAPEPAAAEEAAKAEKATEEAEEPVTEVVSEPEPAQAAEVAPAVKAASVAVPTDPNRFVVSVAVKEASHPAYGKGHSLGFSVNGVSGKKLVVERGKTYIFDVQTDPKHDVYLSAKEIGWGGTPITEGVEGAYTYKGEMTFTPTASTPDKVYYACRNHPYMGAVIHVVNPGETVDLGEQPAASSEKAGQVKKAVVTESKVKQKLMFAEMMVNAQGAKRVMASQNDEAKQLVGKARQSLVDGKAKSSAGALPEALALAERSLALMNEATTLVPSEEEMAQLAETYKGLLAEIQDYEKSHKTNYERMVKAGNAPAEAGYDEAKFAAIKAEAQALADKGNYVRANALLQQAQQIVTVALHKMLHSKTIVYDLNFETPADEYEYELKRYIGYEELIPVAIEAKKPAPGALKLMESFVEKARKRRAEAEQKAAENDYGSAIAMMQQATKTVRRALRMVGVTQ